MARNKYDVDELYEEHFDLGQLKRLGRYVLPYKKDMIIAAILMLSSSAATMLIPRFFMTVMKPFRTRIRVSCFGSAPSPYSSSSTPWWP